MRLTDTVSNISITGPSRPGGARIGRRALGLVFLIVCRLLAYSSMLLTFIFAAVIVCQLTTPAAGNGHDRMALQKRAVRLRLIRADLVPRKKGQSVNFSLQTPVNMTGGAVRKLWRQAAFGVVAATLTAGLVIAATQADASAKPAAQVTQSQQRIVPAACTTARNYKGGSVTLTYCDDSTTRSGCFTGNNGSLHGPLYAANGCQTQLWLWLTRTTSGTPDLCVNPERSTNSLKKYYEEFKVSNATGSCGT